MNLQHNGVFVRALPTRNSFPDTVIAHNRIRSKPIDNKTFKASGLMRAHVYKLRVSTRTVLSGELPIFPEGHLGGFGYKKHKPARLRVCVLYFLEFDDLIGFFIEEVILCELITIVGLQFKPNIVLSVPLPLNGAQKTFLFQVGNQHGVCVQA
jgi:hypothetical protein